MKKKLLRILPLSAVALATLLALFYAWTDWAGARHWKSVEAALRAKGEPLTIAEIEPSPIPDEINFAAAPVFAELLAPSDSRKSQFARIPNFAGGARKGSSRLANAARSLNPKFAGSDEEAARLVLAEASKWQSVFDMLREAAKSPGTYWKLDYSQGFQMKLPQLSPLLKAAQFLSARARAQLQLGSHAAALDDIQLTINLAGRVSPPENLITHLVRTAMLGLAIDAVNFGIERHSWNSDELAAIEHGLSKISFPLELVTALRGERAMGNEFLRKFGFREALQSSGVLSDSESPSLAERALLASSAFYPSGWSLEDRGLYAETIQTLIEALEDLSPRFPERIPQVIRCASGSPSLPERMHTPFAVFAFAVFPSAIRQTFWLQFQIDAARTACAIERYRLAHGALPSTLDALCPEFLSELTPDLITGEPLHYQPGPGDSYTLYSVGWNETDDGGNDVNPKNPNRKNSPDSADWVWKIDSRS